MTIEVRAEFICKFENFSQWVNHAQSWLSGYTNRDKIVCIDQTGKVCNIGADFAYARENNHFPVLAYRLIPSNENYPPPAAGVQQEEVK